MAVIKSPIPLLNFFCGISLISVSTAHAQLDPEPRKLLHLGFNQSLHNDGPQAAYLFYYWNMPNVPATNQVLRLAIAPTYLDGELGFKGVLGENTDLGVGVFGGGFANSYDEVRRGNYFRDESFDGHGGGANVSVYHLFNPGSHFRLAFDSLNRRSQCNSKALSVVSLVEEFTKP